MATKTQQKTFQVGDTVYVSNDLYVPIYLKPAISYDYVDYAKDDKIGIYKGIFTNSKNETFAEFIFDVGSTSLDTKSGFIELDKFNGNFYSNNNLTTKKNTLIWVGLGLVVGFLVYKIWKNSN